MMYIAYKTDNNLKKVKDRLKREDYEKAEKIISKWEVTEDNSFNCNNDDEVLFKKNKAIWMKGVVK